MGIIKIIWQLPQLLLGLIVTKIAKASHVGMIGNVHIYLTNWRWASVSFGPIIILKSSNETIRKHELGHSKQSLLFGPFYLFIVGLYSIIRNIYFRLFKDSWDGYYDAWPENQADKFGGVVR